MRMIEQSAIKLPGFARVSRLEKRSRLNAAVKSVRLVWMTVSNLPHLFQRHVRVFGKLDIVGFGIAPRLAEIVG